MKYSHQRIASFHIIKRTHEKRSFKFISFSVANLFKSQILESEPKGKCSALADLELGILNLALARFAEGLQRVRKNET